MFKNFNIFIFIFFTLLKISSQDSKIDLYKYNFFGFKINQTFDEVVKNLKNKNIDFSFHENSPFKYIYPEKYQGYGNLGKEGYYIEFYDNKIYSILKKDVTKTFFKELKTNIDNYTEIKHYDNRSHEIRKDDLRLIFIENGPTNSFTIQKIEIEKEIWIKEIIKPSNDIYVINNNNTFLYGECYDKYGPVINLNFGEIVEVIEWHNKKFNKTGKWALVNTTFEKSFIGGSQFEQFYILEDNLKKILKFSTPIIDNLRFRKTPSINSEVIRNLNKKDNLILLEIGKTEFINGVLGTWVKVKIEKSEEVGWCFDAYLEPYKVVLPEK